MSSEPSFTTYYWAMVQFKEPEAGTLRSLVAETLSPNSAGSLEPGGCLCTSHLGTVHG